VSSMSVMIRSLGPSKANDRSGPGFRQPPVAALSVTISFMADCR